MRLVHADKYDQVCEALGVGVKDGVPDFEAAEVVPPDQMEFWADLDV